MNIKGGSTIQEWIRKLAKTHLLNKFIHIEMKDEVSKIKELEKEKKALESALAQAQLKIITLESTVKVLEEKAAERLNGILKNEFYLNAAFNNYQDALKATSEAINSYNYLRPHMSIGYMTPESKYAA